jgi:hypothetical protein
MGTPSNVQRLSPSLKYGLRALAVAGDDFEPFVDWILDPNVIGRLADLGLAEQGESNRPSVGNIGYRLTGAGWEAVNGLWGYGERRRTRLLLS